MFKFVIFSRFYCLKEHVNYLLSHLMPDHTSFFSARFNYDRLVTGCTYLTVLLIRENKKKKKGKRIGIIN